jgi:hypothetical protein
VLLNTHYSTVHKWRVRVTTVALSMRVYIGVAASDAAYNLNKTGHDDRLFLQ